MLEKKRFRSILIPGPIEVAGRCRISHALGPYVNSAQCLDVYLWFCIVMHWQLLTKEPRNPAKCNRLKTDEVFEKFRLLQEEVEL